jgi:hypothetical protein
LSDYIWQKNDKSKVDERVLAEFHPLPLNPARAFPTPTTPGSSPRRLMAVPPGS